MKLVAAVRRWMGVATLACLAGAASATTGLTVLAAPSDTGPVTVLFIENLSR